MTTARARIATLFSRTSLLALLGAAAVLPGCADFGNTPLVTPGIAHNYGTWRPALAEVPRTIGESDADLYRRIFADQQRDNWAAADRSIAQLKDKSLLGHVLAQRYLGTYRASPAELRGWLDQYADLPDADRIRLVASRHASPRAPNRTKPRGKTRRAEIMDDAALSLTTSRKPRPPADYRRRVSINRSVATVQSRYQTELRRGNLEGAEAVLNSPGADSAIGATRVDALKTELAIYLLQSGKYDRAYALASAASRSRDSVPNAPWVAGLAGWKLGKHREAAQLFEAVASGRRDGDWPQARAAYWAARAHKDAGNTAESRRWMERAAGFSRTLYGMLARQALGQRQDFNFSQAMPADPAHLARIGSTPEGKRAFGLIQVGFTHHAGEELIRQYRANGETMSETYLAIADRGGLPDLAYHVSGQIYSRSARMYDPGLYPVPSWKPQNGFQVERALVFAIMRQESAFKAKVVSRANARGLMQIIPPTATAMAGSTGVRPDVVARLFDPEYNMELGQKYLRMLLARSDIGGNVAFAAAAYNAGEGALMKWTLRDDPLLFMATIPYTETREYVERVLYNLAAYRLRLGQQPSELEALGQNRWPVLRSQDRT